jgi:signal transduction histidine kinase
VLDGFEAWPHARPAVDAGGRLLLAGGFADTGLDVFRLGPDGAIEFPAGGDSGLREYIWRQLLFSPEGGFWVAHESGLARIEQEALVAFPLTAPGPRLPTIKDLVESPSRDELWISTWHGMYRYHDGRVERVSGLPTRAASRAVALRDGSVWWAEHQSTGFVFRDGRLSPLPRGVDHVAFETTDGARYVGAADGFHRVRDGRRARISSRPHLDGSAVEAAGRLWFTPGFVGVDTIEGDSLGSECRACLPPAVRAVVDSLDQILPREMQGDPFGRVWVPTWNSSLYCLWRSPAGEWHARRFSTADGLLSDDVLSIDPTPDGRLWVGTTRGLQEFRLRPGEPMLEPILEVRGRDGLDGEYVSAVREDRHGFLWLGTTGGKLHRLDPRRLVQLDSPAVRIARLELDGEPAALGPHPPRLRAGRTRVALHLVGRTYQQPRRVRYEYRLAPRDTVWTSLGAGRVVRFPFLPPGRHVIEARAVREGRPPGPVARLSLVAAPPFWRTWWFPPAVAAALLVPAFLWYRSRMERRLAMERLRLRIATDLHDDIGGGLTQVSLYGELIRRASTGPVAGWAERVGEQARALGDAMRDIVWAIHPEQESWEALELRMKDHAVALLGPRGIAFEMTGELRDGARATVLPMDVRRNVLLVFKEALHNAVRHAGCEHVVVRWRLGPRRLGVTIHDDGGGFDPSRAVAGHGLSNLRRRAAEIGGDLAIETAPGAGTTITLEVPL